MERRKDLDFAKGVGIILMVLGHCYSEGNGSMLRTWFYAFHMPLFFVISGILARGRSLPSFASLLKKRTRSLLVPYYFWGVIAALFLTVMGRKPLEWLWVLLKCVVTWEGLSAMWFLPCLFFAELLFQCCLRAAKRHPIFGHVMAAAIAVIGFVVPCSNIYMTSLMRSFTGASFIYLGWLLADWMSRPVKPCAFGFLCVVQVVLSLYNGQVNVLGKEYGNFLLFYLNALLGSWLVIQLYGILASVLLERVTQTLMWFGQNSLIVVCTSLYAIEFLRLADYKLFSGMLSSLGVAEGIILCALAMLMEVFIILFCNRYLSVLFGKKVLLVEKSFMK